jgi:hypothetical protein
LQRQRQQHIPVGDDIPAAENSVANHGHRGSYNGPRSRSGSHLSNAASPLNAGFSPSAQGQQQTVFPASSPRHGPMRDTLSGSPNPSGNYLLAGPPRTGHPAQIYGHSPRGNSGSIHGPFGYQQPLQYSNGVGGMGEGRDSMPKDYFGSGSNPLSPPTGREGPGMLGATGPHGSRVWGAAAGGQGYMNQYASHGRDPPSRAGQNAETDLSPDEASY